MTSESNHVAPKWKNAVALAILCAYILLMVFKSVRAPVPATMLPAKLRDFLVFTTAELALFGAFWLISWCFSRADADELLLRWRGGWQPIWKGLLYSLALRMVPVLFFVWLFAIAVLCGVKLDSIEHLVARYGPTNERVISSVALADPLYRLILMTWGSFVVAGFREELWRTAMLAISTRLLQPALSQRTATFCALIFSSALFGVAHLYQGWLAVGVTAFIGLTLGTIMLKHRSIWPAVIAHGAFDALSFWAMSQHGIGRH